MDAIKTKTGENFQLIGRYVYYCIGTDRKQICHGGRFIGDTVMASSSEAFRLAVAKWRRQRRAKSQY